MKKINLFLFIYYILFFLFIILSFIDFFILKDGYDNLKYSQDSYSTCESTLTSNEISDMNDYDYCKELLSFDTPTSSSFYIFESVLSEGFLGVIFPYFIPFIVIFPFIFIISKLNSSKFIKNYIIRNTYKNYVSELYKRCYKYIFIIPSFVIFLFLICVIITKNLNPTADIHFMLLGNDLLNLYSSPIFYISYIFILILNMGIYINVGLFILSKNKNFLISLIESYLSIYVIWCISEILLGLLFQNLFNISASYFSLLTIYKWRNIQNIGIYLLVNLFWWVFTFILSLRSYRNREKYLIMCEK